MSPKDYQFIHVDVEKAKQTPFGGTMVHGFLTSSMMPVLADEPHMVATRLRGNRRQGYDGVTTPGVFVPVGGPVGYGGSCLG